MSCQQQSMPHIVAHPAKQRRQGSDTGNDTVSQASVGGRAKSHRFSPYARPQGSLSCSLSHQSTLLTPSVDQEQQTASLGLAALQQQTVLRQQSPDALLDIAISLASRSLSRTVAAFQAACQCWTAGADPALTNHALEVAEAAMARTIRRMELAQQLAAAVFQKEPAGLASLQPVQCLQQQQLEQLTGLMAALQQNRQQQLLAALPAEEEEDGEEEVCSSWAPCSPALQQ